MVTVERLRDAHAADRGAFAASAPNTGHVLALARLVEPRQLLTPPCADTREAEREQHIVPIVELSDDGMPPIEYFRRRWFRLGN